MDLIRYLATNLWLTETERLQSSLKTVKLSCNCPAILHYEPQLMIQVDSSCLWIA